MDSIKDITLGEFANLSYIDLPSKLKKKVDDKEYITLKELADISIGEYLAKEKSGELSDQKKDILDILRKCQSGEYKDYKIVNYDNDNGKSGFVGYAIENSEGDVIIASRGSEMPDKDKDDKSKGFEDWIDNVQISTKYGTAQQKAAKDFVNKVGLKDDEDTLDLSMIQFKCMKLKIYINCLE